MYLIRKHLFQILPFCDSIIYNICSFLNKNDINIDFIESDYIYYLTLRCRHKKNIIIY